MPFTSCTKQHSDTVMNWIPCFLASSLSLKHVMTKFSLSIFPQCFSRGSVEIKNPEARQKHAECRQGSETSCNSSKLSSTHSNAIKMRCSWSLSQRYTTDPSDNLLLLRRTLTNSLLQCFHLYTQRVLWHSLRSIFWMGQVSKLLTATLLWENAHICFLLTTYKHLYKICMA